MTVKPGKARSDHVSLKSLWVGNDKIQYKSAKEKRNLLFHLREKSGVALGMTQNVPTLFLPILSPGFSDGLHPREAFFS